MTLDFFNSTIIKYIALPATLPSGLKRVESFIVLSITSNNSLKRLVCAESWQKKPAYSITRNYKIKTNKKTKNKNHIIVRKKGKQTGIC